MPSSDATNFVFAVAALRKEADLVMSNDRRDIVTWPMLRQRDCLAMVREILGHCPDEAPSESIGRYEFIEDEELRNSLLIDLGSIESALQNQEWKAATVLAGSMIEALLLWAITQHSDAEVSQAKGKLARARIQIPGSEPIYWSLGQFIDVALQLRDITADAASAAKLSNNFRNLIHPGRAQRTGLECHRGTAHSA